MEGVTRGGGERERTVDVGCGVETDVGKRERAGEKRGSAGRGISCATWSSVCATPLWINNHALRRTLGSAIVEGVSYGASAPSKR